MKCTCGSLIFDRFTPAAGVWQEELTFNEDGSIAECITSTDGLMHDKPPKTIRCAECKKRYPNPEIQTQPAK